MSAIRLVTVSGPRGAGKETVVTAICSEFKLHRIVPHTTRSPRPTEMHGREYFFVSMAEFEAMLARDEFIFNGKIGESQRSGTHRSQFELAERGSIIDITPAGARTLCSKVQNELSGMALMLGVFAEQEERRERIAKRDTSIGPEKVEQLLRDDPVSPNKDDYGDFNLLIDNCGCDPRPACDRALDAVRGFLNCS